MKKTKETSSISAEDVALTCAAIVEDKKAESILVLDIRKVTFVADYFVICTGFNERQLQTMADEIQKKMKEQRVRSFGMAGYHEAIWILLDLGDVVVHLFDSEAREAYNLEGLWADADQVPWQEALANRA